jgi:hypothetical protein
VQNNNNAELSHNRPSAGESEAEQYVLLVMVLNAS